MMSKSSGLGFPNLFDEKTIWEIVFEELFGQATFLSISVPRCKSSLRVFATFVGTKVGGRNLTTLQSSFIDLVAAN